MLSIAGTYAGDVVDATTLSRSVLALAVILNVAVVAWIVWLIVAGVCHSRKPPAATGSQEAMAMAQVSPLMQEESLYSYVRFLRLSLPVLRRMHRTCL